MAREYDIRRIEVIDDQTAEAMRRLGGPRRIRMMSELSGAGRVLMAARVRDQHPDWMPEQIRLEVARRLRNAAA
jgi:hypothetical protein